MRRVSIRFALLVGAATLLFGAIAGAAPAVPTVGNGPLRDAGARSLSLHLDKGGAAFVAAEHDASEWLTFAVPRRGSSNRSPLPGSIPAALATLLSFFAFTRRARSHGSLAQLRATRNSSRAPPFAALT